VPTNRAKVGTSLTILAFGSTMFATLGPTLIGLREQSSDSESRRHLRIAQVVGTTSVLALGAGLAFYTTDSDVLVIGASVLVAGGLAGMYQWALSHPKQPD
jgi:hypothetical protein